jgi:adenylosuccinate synthase
MSLIRRDWIPERIKSFGIDFNSHSDQLRAKLEPMLNVLNDLDFMRHAQRLVDAAAGLELGQPTIEGNLVIEGAQGLQLDQDLGIFPHVTRSMTGLGSAIVTANELGRKSVQPVYITRCYLTRHGAGPLEHEKIRFTEQKLFDQTNQPNQWQGTLRYAPLNLVQLEDFIRRDCVRGAEFASRMKIELEQPTIAVTCLDQVGSEISMFGADQELVTIPTENAASYIADTLKLRLSHSSRGPSAADVQFM